MLIANLTSLKISFHFKAVMSEMGRYPFASTLIAVPRYVAVLSILYIMKHICPVQFSDKAVSLLSNAVSLMHLHKVT